MFMSASSIDENVVVPPIYNDYMEPWGQDNRPILVETFKQIGVSQKLCKKV